MVTVGATDTVDRGSLARGVSAGTPSATCTDVVLGVDVAGAVVEVLVAVVAVTDVAGWDRVGSDVTTTAAGGSAGAGFCHTDRAVDAPMLGNKVSRMAYTVPADPINTVPATIATASGLPNQAHLGRERTATPASLGAVARSGASACPSPCPRSSQPSATHQLCRINRQNTIRPWS